VRDVTGLESTTDGIPVQGMLDPDILTTMMRASGMQNGEIVRVMPAVIERAQEVYIPSVPDLRDKACPGARGLLEELGRRDVLLALVTGNLTRIGWHKLGRAGLGQYFRYGAFGETAEDRAGLARAAIATARREYGLASDAPMSLIGDAPADILAAQANGVHSIAVCTGLTSREELATYRPDLLLDDLCSLETARLIRSG
jgi:phosphoglycolate phosphatase-like HAD superfamily hydrolase